jgi:hypothetical protein
VAVDATIFGRTRHASPAVGLDLGNRAGQFEPRGRATVAMRAADDFDVRAGEADGVADLKVMRAQGHRVLSKKKQGKTAVAQNPARRLAKGGQSVALRWRPQGSEERADGRRDAIRERDAGTDRDRDKDGKRADQGGNGGECRTWQAPAS